MKKLLFLSAIVAVLCSCDSSSIDDKSEIIDENVKILIDRDSYVRLIQGCHAENVFFCSKCGVYHIQYKEYDYDD